MLRATRKPTPYSDAQLIRSIAGGEQDSLALLYDRYSALVFGLLLRILDNRTQAEEMLQSVFVEVWRDAIDFDQTHSQPSVWLITLAHRLAIDQRRALTAGVNKEINATYDLSLNDTKLGHSANFSQQRTAVRCVLDELPENHRQALMLAYFEGLRPPEISVQLGEPLLAVETGLCAGLIKLRNALHVSAENEHNVKGALSF